MVNILMTIFLVWLFYIFVIKIFGSILFFCFFLYLFHLLIKSRFFSQFFRKKKMPNVDALRGKAAVVVEKIIGKETGLVKVCDQVWSAETDNYTTLNREEKVFVVRVYRDKLMVRRSNY